MMMIIPESIVTEEVDLEDDSDEQEQESKRRPASNSGGDQSWNLNYALQRPTSPEPELWMMNVGSLPPKNTKQLDRTEVDPEADDEGLSSESSSLHEQQQLQFYYWDAIRWVEFPMKINTLLEAALKRNSETVILPVVHNRLHKIDFKDKSQMNLKTGYVRSIAWEGSSTGSRELTGFDKPFERQELLPGNDCLMMMSCSQGKHHQQHGLKSIGATSADSPPRAPPHTNVNVRPNTAAAAMLPVASCPFHSKAEATFGKLGDRVAVLQAGNKEFNAVNDVFNKGFNSRLPLHGKRPRLTVVHKVINNVAKLRYFGEHLQSMERSRGNANLVHAWHGSSADAIVSIVMYGFGQRPLSRNGNNFGCGTYLAPCSKLEVSAQYAEADDNNEQHVLLCEVVLGESEAIPPGSCHRFLPSTTSYDSGVDDLDNPNLYIIWTPFINSHIIPWYIVSFVTEEDTQKYSGPLRRSPEIIRPSPYFPSCRQPRIVELKHENNLFHPSGLRTFSESTHCQLELLGRTSAALPAMADPRRENSHNYVVDEGSDTCLVKALNASKERLPHATARSTRAVKTTHHQKNNSNLDEHMAQDGKSSLSGRINLTLGLNIDGFSHQSRYPKWSAQSLRHQQTRK